MATDGTTTARVASDGRAATDEISRGLFGRGRRLMRTHPLAADTLLAAVLLALSSAWLAGSGFASYRAAIVQTVLIAALAARRLLPIRDLPAHQRHRVRPAP